MKQLALLFIVAAIGAGCHELHRVQGSGHRQRQVRTVGSFTSISTQGAYEIQVVSQKPFAIEVEGDDNVLPLISTNVSSNVLHIKNQQGYSVSEPVLIKISVPDLEGFSASGAGSIGISGLKNEKFEIDVNGAPELRVAGETKVVDIKANGAGTIDTHRLRASRAVVSSNGAAKVDVYASEQLDVKVAGASSVIYDGDPVVNQSVSGPGSVKKKASTPS